MYWICKNGNSYIRYIIENLFVRSFDNLRKNLKPQQWKFLYQEIPRDFRNVYYEQTEKDKGPLSNILHLIKTENISSICILKKLIKRKSFC
ncbi:hypothetical protein CHRY9390_00325 [Chryseobacterium aquaeductus]|uniref:DUF7674 domain-containing protein n=1 Tax=Chryseobacterium aquaeductus TaxID=2675056 RepID=A0A9N8QR69_9FLAO|nr:hypothetical protein CHRY9390_00325 [Chryseobacterium potabilaquae]CAD7798364.1 hypothetical protein CHRY9390_00325 [Chryseobacterium aquaeductus]